jgi:catechol 2,3-dioxygenase-like lactoylglutathione lyase family enzyme
MVKTYMPHITQSANVIVPVRDQARAVDFYTGILGFETRMDFPYDTGERWVEVVPPGAETALTLVASDAAGIETRVIFVTTDIEGDRAELAHAGVEVGEIMPQTVTTWGGAPLAGNPPMFVFSDPDGNTFLMVHAP